ncbi:MAG: ABC transporter ATP-binding protein [Thermoplasmatales archaeon]|nr:MAG: ABC transporter ATP-binding protein [Thermoplasmatales archaeon]
MSDILIISGLTKIYGTQVKTTALASIDLKVKQGEFIALTGESGCGKTTLLNLIAGLDNPTDGSIIIDGVDITTLPDQQLAEIRCNKIGIVFQFFNLIPTLTASENIEISMMIAKKSDGEQQRRAKELLKIVGLADKANSKPDELSGGEQQRVAIARALANNSTLILMDEPTGNLDSKTSKDLMKHVRKLNQEGKTIIMATHDQMVAKDTNRVICLQDGKIKKTTS